MRMSAQQHTKRDLYYAASSLYRFHEKNVGASRPYLEGRLAFIRQGLVFRLFSTPKRLLAQMDNGLHA